MVFDACERYQAVDDDGDADGYIDWQWVYCNTESSAFVVIFVSAFFFTIIMMNVLGSTADDYFVPVLHTIAYVCRMRADVAGITLLAFGNGAPDIITAVTGIVGAGNFGLVIGNLLGGSNFIFMIIQGAVLQTAHRIDPEKKGYIQLDKGTFVRDLLAYTSFIGLIIGFSATGALRIWHMIVLALLYIIYVAIVFKTGASTTGDIYETHLKHRAIEVTHPHHDRASTSSIDMDRMSVSSEVSAAREMAKVYREVLAHAHPHTHRISSSDMKETKGRNPISMGIEADRARLQDGGGDVDDEDRLLAMDTRARSLSRSVVSHGKTGLGSVTSGGNGLNKVTLVDLMQESGDALEDLGDTLPGLEPPEDCCCTTLDFDSERIGVNGEGEIEGEVGPVGRLAAHAKLVIEWICYLTELPLSLLRVVSIPCVDQGWGYKRRVANAVSWPLGLIVTVLGFVDYDDVSSLAWGLVAGIGIALGLLYLYTTSNGEIVNVSTMRESLLSGGGSGDGYASTTPVNTASPMLLNEERKSNSYWFVPVLLLAFLSSVAWMNIVAGELVNSAISVAVETGLSTSILGLTLVAWGNSIGDYVADVAVCQSGAPFTAICSTIGSPMLSAIIGIVLSVTLAIAQSGNMSGYVACHLTVQVWVSYAFLVVAQFSTLAVALYNDYRLPVKWSYALWTLYACFLVSAISIELSVDEDAD